MVIGLVCSGSRWLVGNGANVSVWNSPWIPRPHTFRPTSRPNTIPFDAMVSTLIDYGKGGWNVELIKECFNSCDVEAILDIHLCTSWPDDKIIWHYTSNGMFSVKSAYHLASNIKRRSQASTSNSGGKDLWKLIWNTNVPPRVKIFGWKVGANAIATRGNYASRVKGSPMSCEICGACEESDAHALFVCPLAVDVWAASGFEVEVWDVNFPRAVDYLLRAASILNGDDLDDFLGVMWGIWNSRNAFIFGNDRGDRRNVGLRARAFVANFRKLQVEGKPKATMTRDQIWKPPPSGIYKLNFDARTGRGNGRGWGFVLRDCNGEVRLAGTKQGNGWISPEVEEANACIFALLSLVEHGVQKVIVEGDCSSLMSKINKKERVNSFIGFALDEIFGFFDAFEFISFVYVSRKANSVSHELANLQPFSNRELVWRDDFPDFIHDLAAADLCNSLTVE